MSSTDWRFPSVDGGEEDGVNDPLQSYFVGSSSLAREVIQNSLDAGLDNGRPVVVEFALNRIPTHEFPDRGRLLQVLRAARTQSSGEEKAGRLYDEAIEVLEADELEVLSITDRNTTGLTGAEGETAGNWHRLVRQQGGSGKHGGAGGSFGIGKGAPFALSRIRTVFYATRTAEGVAFLGKARLSSFIDQDHDLKRGTGFFGRAVQVRGHTTIESIRDEEGMPDRFGPPTERGTSIHIPGCVQLGESWHQDITRAVVENFWAAIHCGRLEVHLPGAGVVISSATLDEVIQHHLADNETLGFHYRALRDVPARVQELRHLGRVRFHLLVEKGAPRRTMMMRRPLMVVEQRTSTFNLEFAGVLICDDERGNRLLRDMEPPEHNKWDPNRAPDSQQAGRALRELVAFIRDTLREQIPKQDATPERIPALEGLLPRADDDLIVQQVHSPRTKDQVTEQETGALRARPDEGRARVRNTDRPHTVRVPSPSGSTGNRPPRGEKKEGEPSSGGTKKPSTPTGSKSAKPGKAALVQARAWPVARDGGYVYQVVLHADGAGTGDVRLTLQGDGTTYAPHIREARDMEGRLLQTSGQTIHGVPLDAAAPTRLLVRLTQGGRYRLGVTEAE
ncbi:hypothetical protein [Deinococcus hohokamensis]|uniref:ATP-binding protein n=1 Tax=Deinococcus hohokamensis TaxID=309883 RepID=A0ABV9ICH9_9DEIO